MVESIKKFLIAPINGLHQAAVILGASALASQLLALVRDRIFAHIFGAGSTLDIYYAAFKIPDFLFVTIASLVSMTVLIPYFSREYNDDKEKARFFLDSVFSVFFWLLVGASIITYFLIPWLSLLLTPGFDHNERLQYISLARILLLSPMFLGLSGYLASIVQSFRKFSVYALSPVLYNVGIIIGATVIYPTLGVAGLAWGVVLGSFLHFAIQWPTASSTGYGPRLRTNIWWPKVREVLLISIPRTITLGAAQIAGLALTALASLLVTGSITIYNFAFNLQSAPLAIIGVSFSMAAFPTLSSLFSSGDKQEFARQMRIAASQIIFWSLPVTALIVVLRAQIVRTVLGSGLFDWTSTRLVAAGLAIFAISLVAQGLVLLFVRGYYATGRTLAPLYSNILSAVFIIASAPALVYLFRHYELFRYFIESLFRVDDVGGAEVLMLPLAYSLGVILNAILHWWHFGRSFEFLGLDSNVVRHSIYGAVCAGSVAYVGLLTFSFLNTDTLIGIFTQGLLAGLMGIISGMILLYSLKNEEFLDIIGALRAKVWSRGAILPPPEETTQ